MHAKSSFAKQQEIYTQTHRKIKSISRSFKLRQKLFYMTARQIHFRCVKLDDLHVLNNT